MDWADAQLLMAELAPVIREFVAASIKPVADRLASLEDPEGIIIDGDVDEGALVQQFRRALEEVEPIAIAWDVPDQRAIHAETAAAYRASNIDDWLRGVRAKGDADETLRDAVDAMIAAHPSTAPMTVFRGFGDADAVGKLTKRSVLKDRAYLPVSRSEQLVRETFAEDGGYIARIAVPPGSSAYEFDPGDPEDMVLLPRNSRLRMTDIDHDQRMVSFKLLGRKQR